MPDFLTNKKNPCADSVRHPTLLSYKQTPHNMTNKLTENEKRECEEMLKVKEQAIANTQIIKDKIELIKDSVAA
jgi:hypothetical protein